MKVTRANEYWGALPEEAPRRTAADIEALLSGPRIYAGMLRWAEGAAEADDPSKMESVLPKVAPHLQRIEHDLNNGEGGSSPNDGTPEHWPITLPGDKLLNVAEDAADTLVGLPAKGSPKKVSGRRKVALKELWLRVAAIQPGDLHATGKYLGTHDAQVHEDAQGQRWLVKPPGWDESWPAPLDVATGQLQQRAGLTSPEIQQVNYGGVPTAVHKMFPATDAFPGKRLDHNNLSPQDLMTLQKHNVLDWLISNHDSHPGQFIRHRDTGELIGIDKGQAFKHFGVDQLDPSFHPNARYGETEPIYNTMWRNFSRGQGPMNDPRGGELGQFIQNIQSIPDEELHGIFRPFAEEAARAGKLGTGGGLGKPSGIIPNNVDSFLSALSGRKNNLHNDFGQLYDRLNPDNPMNHIGFRY